MITKLLIHGFRPWDTRAKVDGVETGSLSAKYLSMPLRAKRDGVSKSAQQPG